MKKYSPHWRTVFLTAIIFHFFIGMIFFFALPYFFPKNEPKEIQEISWIDVNFVENEISADEEKFENIPENVPARQEIFSAEFPPIILPPAPEPVYIEKKNNPPAEIPEPPKILKNPLPTKKEESEIKNNSAENKKSDEVQKEGRQLLKVSPVTVKEFYPPKEKLSDFKSYVSVAVTIDKEGKVTQTKIVLPSGNTTIDNLVEEYAKKWLFKPALDQDEKPMECEKIITFDFKKFADN